MSLPVIAEINTPCKYCAFGLWVDKTQVGCVAERLKQFKDANVELVECFDDEAEFFVINGRNCNYFRNVNTLGDFDVMELLKQVKEETTIKCDLILMANDLAKLENSIGAVKSWTVKPNTLILLNNNYTTQEIIDVVTETKYIGKWKIVTKQEDMVDLWVGAQKCESKWFIMGNPLEMDKDVIEKVDNLLNVKMEKFVHIYDKHFSLYNLAAYKFIACEKDPYPNKTFLKLDEEQKGNMCKSWQSLTQQ